MKKELDLINKYQREIILLNQVYAFLDWDEKVFMPEQGIKSRSEQTALLSKLVHEKLVSSELYNALNKLRKARLNPHDKLMVEKLHKSVSRARKLPKEFVEELSKTLTLASQAWLEARKKNNFEVFRPHLEKIIELKRKEANYLRLPGHLYNALLDQFEEGMTVEKLKPVFNKLKNDLVFLIKKIENSPAYKKQKKVILEKEFSREEMQQFVNDMAYRMGLKKVNSRLDISEHPFTTKIGYNDVRLTTNFRKDPLFSVGSTVHEAGHALYELQMPEKDAYNVLGDSPSLGLHESQSRFWENNIGRGKAFWRYYFPQFNRVFRLNSKFEDWYKEVNFVTPGKIRIESDEVHYCLHIVLRFEIETGLIDGSIKVKDLPNVWNAKMKELFGVVPKNYVEGVLQDVHWAMGAVGYFPTYAIGTMYAAQIFETLKKKYPFMEKDLAKGNFSKVSKWLGDNIHKHGSKYLADDLIKKVCGQRLNPDVYMKYLENKYREIYGFE